MTLPPWRKIEHAEPDGSRVLLRLACGHSRTFTPHAPYEKIKDSLRFSTFPCLECGRSGEGGDAGA